MKLTVLAVGTRMPSWVEQGVAEYHKRLPPELQLSIRELPLAQRGNQSSKSAIDKESNAIRDAIPARDQFVLLDVLGKQLSTEQLAQRLAGWQMSGDNISLVIGGPDGVNAELKRDAGFCWSLAPLTLPHPLVRVVLVEQLYRAWSINAGHPYHRS